MVKRGDEFHPGHGVANDDIEALNWYRRAADLNYPPGQSGEAMMYLWGWGSPKNYPEAARLFRLAADQGDARGLNGLGIMNEYGYAMGINHAEAQRLYQMAAAKGWANARAIWASLTELRGLPRATVRLR